MQTRVDWKITKFIPDCSPVKKTATVGQVVLIIIIITSMVMTMTIIPSQMEVAPLHCTVDITQKRRLFKNTKEIEKM